MRPLDSRKYGSTHSIELFSRIKVGVFTLTFKRQSPVRDHACIICHCQRQGCETGKLGSSGRYTVWRAPTSARVPSKCLSCSGPSSEQTYRLRGRDGGIFNGSCSNSRLREITRIQLQVKFPGVSSTSFVLPPALKTSDPYHKVDDSKLYRAHR